jgi:hypothetical protein
MTSAVQQFLASFDALTAVEKQHAVVEVLRRIDQLSPSDFPEEAFVAAAEELFLDLDAREAGNGQR